jgi:ABC-2 family transporter protein
MIWLVLRRHRVLLGVVALVIIGLGLWMYLLGRAYESALTSQACHYNTFRCPLNSGAWSISNQATALNFLVLLLPCLLGVIFGAPLVAGELERHTNRLAWTQGISRTKWLILKWLTVFLTLAIMVIALTIVAQWWAGRTYERVPGLVLGDVGGPVALFLGQSGRMQPEFFPTTGLAPVAYTLLALALGAALGALFRKVSWAIVGTIALYAAVSVVMVLFVRPSLAPQVFVAYSTSPQGNQQVLSNAYKVANGAWDLGFGYRYAPGSLQPPNSPSADMAAQRCEYSPAPSNPGQSALASSSGYTACLVAHHVQTGTYYQPNSHYWSLQWRESGILAATAALLFGATILLVRRWST